MLFAPLERAQAFPDTQGGNQPQGPTVSVSSEQLEAGAEPQNKGAQ